MTVFLSFFISYSPRNRRKTDLRACIGLKSKNTKNNNRDILLWFFEQFFISSIFILFFYYCCIYRIQFCRFWSDHFHSFSFRFIPILCSQLQTIFFIFVLFYFHFQFNSIWSLCTLHSDTAFFVVEQNTIYDSFLFFFFIQL